MAYKYFAPVNVGEMIGELIRRKGFNQRNFALKLGVSPQSVNAWVKGKKGIDPDNLPAVAALLGISVDTLLSGKIPDVNASVVIAPSYVELPYISVAARTVFINSVSSEQDYAYPSTYRIIAEADTNYEQQVIIEVDGDSMEPYYPTGTKVRCKPVIKGDWEFINSGVYAVCYARNFVIKRIKSNDFSAGFIMLHSDNTDTGGAFSAPIAQIHHIWKVLRIVDAPAR